MNNSDKIIEEYISKLFEVQRARENQPLTEKELKEIAIEAGMTEEDWQAAQQTYQDHIVRAEGFLVYKNWSDAIAEYRQALRIKPNDTQALSSIAYAYKMRWTQHHQSADQESALVFAHRCLQIAPQNSQSLIIISELSKQSVSKPLSNNSQIKTVILVTIAVFAILAVFWFQVSPSEHSSNSEELSPTSKERTSGTQKSKPLPQGMVFSPSDKVNLEVKEISSTFKKLFGNRTSHHVNCSFKNNDSRAIQGLKVEVTWYDKDGLRIIQRDFNVIRPTDSPLLPQAQKNHLIKQNFPRSKTQSNYQYFRIKVIKTLVP